MRNLLSFVLGVISRLLYLLLRLILLLDRTICRIYDLPVRSRFAGVMRQAGRRRSVCALSVFGLLFLLPALLLTRPGTLLLADGQPLGVIEDSATLLNAVNAVESSASAVSGTDYYLPLRLTGLRPRTRQRQTKTYTSCRPSAWTRPLRQPRLQSPIPHCMIPCRSALT